jgi:hypothetical protein
MHASPPLSLSLGGSFVGLEWTLGKENTKMINGCPLLKNDIPHIRLETLDQSESFLGAIIA